MPIERIWLTPTVRSFPFPPNPSCRDFPVPGSTTGRFSHRQKKFLFGTGLTRSPPVGLSSAVGALRLFSKGKDSLWGGSIFKQLCGKWELKGFIPVPILVNALFRTRSIPISSRISAPNILNTFGGSTLRISDWLRDGCISLPLSTGIPSMSCPGSSIRHSKCGFSWTVWIGLLKPLCLPFSTVTREAFLPATAISNVSCPGTSRSVWMGKVEPSIMFLLKGYGEL